MPKSLFWSTPDFDFECHLPAGGLQFRWTESYGHSLPDLPPSHRHSRPGIARYYRGLHDFVC